MIQGWLLITLYLRVTHRQTSCSHALGQAMDMVKSMGLGFAHDNAKFYSSTAYERLKAKRIFWCVFTFDRVFGLQTDGIVVLEMKILIMNSLVMILNMKQKKMIG